MIKIRLYSCVLAAGIVAMWPAWRQVLADEAVLSGGRDSTIQSDDISGSNGAGPNIFVGRTLCHSNRRALVWFDLTSSVPANVTITSVVVQLVMDRTPSPPIGSRLIALHRVTQDWGEAGSLGGGLAGGAGAPAETNDVTWQHTFFPNSFWTNMGGDYVGSASAILGVNNPGIYRWSAAQLVTDVQAWLNTPPANYGWILIGDETVQSAARFVSREHSDATNRPVLIVGYTADPPPSSISDFVWEDLNTNGVQEPGESGISNLVVRLYDPGTNLLGQTATDTYGIYAFTNLSSGNYIVEFEAPFGWMFAPVNTGDDALDSDANPENGFTDVISLGVGDDDDSVDAGLFAPFVIKTLYPVRDTTIYEDPDGLLANGAGTIMYAGRSGQASNSIRRALLRFDISGEIPWESEVLDAELSLTVMRASGPGFVLVSVHRADLPWGEGASFAPGGAGTQAQTNDATWLHAAYSNRFWSNPGGDFSAAVSAAQAVSTDGVHSFASALLTSDVQQWVNNIPNGNFGWLLKGNESSAQTARVFGTREQTAMTNRPMLRVIYVPSPPRPLPFLVIR